MSLDQLAQRIARYLGSLPEVRDLVLEEPEPISFSESSPDIFVRRCIVTWSDGQKYNVEIRPTA